MKKLLKSFLIATASIGTIAGSTAAVVSCGDKTPDAVDNQKKYNDALATLTTMLGDTHVLGAISVPEGTTVFTETEKTISGLVNALIAKTDSIKEILGTATVTIPNGAMASTPTPVGGTISGNLNLTVTSKITDGVTVPTTPSNFKVTYSVANQDQMDYNNEVTRIVGLLTGAASTHTILDGQQSAVNTSLEGIFNAAVGSNANVAQFTSTTLGAVESQFWTAFSSTTAGSTGNIAIKGLVFTAKKTTTVTTQTPQDFTFNFTKSASPTDVYNSQIQTLTDAFVGATSTGKTIVALSRTDNPTEVSGKLKTAVDTIITNQHLTLLSTAQAFTLSGITDGDFLTAYSLTASNTLTSNVKLVIGSTDASVTTATAEHPFNFYYTVSSGASDTTDYNDAFTGVQNYFTDLTASTADHPIQFTYNASAGDAWQTSVIANIKTNIAAYISSSPEAQKVFDTGTSNSGIEVTIPAGATNFVNAVSTTQQHYTQTNITFTITPKYGDITKHAAVNLTFYYTVLGTVELYNSAVTKIKTHFAADANQIAITRQVYGATPKTAAEYLQEAVRTYVTDSSATDATKLTPNEAAVIGTVTVNSTTVTNITDNLVPVITSATANITIAPTTAVTIPDADKTIAAMPFKYTIIPNSDDNTAQAQVTALLAAFITATATDPLIFKTTDAAVDIEKSIKDKIDSIIQDDTTTYSHLLEVSSIIGVVVSNTDEEGKFNLSSPADNKSVSVSSIVVNTTAYDGDPGSETPGKYVTSPAHFATSSMIHYKVVKGYTDQDYTTAVAAVIKYFGKNNIFLLSTTATDDAIKAAIRNSIKTYVESTGADALSADQKAVLNVGVAASIDVSIANLDKSEGTHNTDDKTHTITVTIPAVSGLKQSAIVFTNAQYQFTAAPATADYTGAQEAILNHFKQDATNLFSATIAEMGDGTNDATNGVKAVVKARIQKNIYDYITTYTGTGALTAPQKVALGDLGSNGANITVTIKGALPHAAGANQPTDADKSVIINVPATSTLSSSDKELTGAKYTIVGAVDPAAQTAYDAAVADVGAKLSAASFFDPDNGSITNVSWFNAATDPSKNHAPEGTTKKVYSPTQYALVLNTNNSWLSYIKSSAAIGQVEHKDLFDALTKSINDSITSGALDGTYTIAITSPDDIDFTNIITAHRFTMTITFNAKSPGVVTKAITQDVDYSAN